MGTGYIISRFTDPSWQFRDTFRQKVSELKDSEWVCGLTANKAGTDVWICNLLVSLSSISSGGSSGNEKLIEFPQEKIINKNTSRKVYITDKDNNKLWYMFGNSGQVLGLLKLTKSSTNSKPEITFCKKEEKTQCSAPSACNSSSSTCKIVGRKVTGTEVVSNKYKNTLWKINYLR